MWQFIFKMFVQVIFDLNVQMLYRIFFLDFISFINFFYRFKVYFFSLMKIRPNAFIT